MKPTHIFDNSRLSYWLAVDINSTVIAGAETEAECSAKAAQVEHALPWQLEGATEAAYSAWLRGTPNSDLDFLDGVYLRT